jgi:PTH2 family peptidyl-tRNA hydrolase
MAEEMGMVEGKDYYLIKDSCRTELEPEEIDENGVGRILTCIGFKPMDSEIIDKIGRKYHLYV